MDSGDKGNITITGEVLTLFDRLDELMLICDLEGQITYSNSKSINYTGFTVQELVGRNFTDLFDTEQDFSIAGSLFSKKKVENENALEIYYKTKTKSKKKAEAKFEKVIFKESEGVLVIVCDVSETPSYQSVIREYELRQAALLDNIPYHAWMKDKQGRFIVANDKFVEAMGQKKSDIKGMRESDFLPEERWKKYREQDEEVMRKGYGKFQERINIKGKEYWFETIKTAIKADNGNVIGTTGISREFTQSRKDRLFIEDSLKRQEVLTDIAYSLSKPEEFNARINSSLKLIGEFLNVSRVYIFENDYEADVTRNTFEWCNRGIEPQIENLDPLPMSIVPTFFEMLREEKIILASDIFNLPEDVIQILEPQDIKAIAAYPIYVDNKIFGFIGFDDCERNRNWNPSEIELLKTVSHMISNGFQENLYLSALKNSEQKYRELVELLPEIVLETDEEGFIIFANNYALKKFKFDRKKIEKKKIHFFDIIDPDDKALAIQEITKILNNKEGTSREFEFCVVNEFIDRFPVLLFLNTTVRGDTFKGLRAVMVDITERKLAEERLQEAKQKAEEASKAKEHFLATMSHEIRTPLNAIIGMVNLMKDGEMEGEEEEAIQTLELSSRHLLNLINDILDFSKIEAGKVTIQQVEFDLVILLENVVRLFRQKAQEKGIDLSLHIGNSMPKLVEGDSGRLMQILTNLVSNAIKFTHKGSVKITATIIEQHEDEVKIEFNVKDTGIGIPKRKQNIIFDSFSQVESTRTRKFEGTGLGLAITKKLLDLMDSEISVKSKVNEGSSFVFTITFRVSSADNLPNNANQADKAELDNLEGLNILIAEDNVINQKIAVKFLRRWKANVEVASNGEEALNEVKRGEYDLILMDIQMPVMDGYEATRKIRQLKGPKNEVPIIALTASALLEAQKEVFEAGMNDFITKPFNPKELFDKIKQSAVVNQ